MPWISGNRYLSMAEMTNNAQLIMSQLTAQGWTKNAVAGMLGNMQSESTINPGIWESLNPDTSRGFGLVQWTPASKLISWAQGEGKDYTSGDTQLDRINWEVANNQQWIATSQYPMSFQQFKVSTLTPEYLAQVFIRNYERPLNPNQPIRSTQARYWYDHLDGEGCSYTPRLSKQGMQNSRYWYTTYNPFYASGYGLPNCTAYAWGRFWEISNASGFDELPTLSTGNGGQWYDYSADGYTRGDEPQLGAVVCFDQPGEAGHVAIVEEILENGDIITSNSGYSRSPGGYNDPKYFWTETNPKSTGYRSDWEVSGGYQLQGFIYNPYACQGGFQPESRKTGMPLYMYLFL